MARIVKFGSARLVSGDFGLNTSSNAGELTSEVREIALESGSDLVGTVSAEAIDSLPAIWVGWKIQDYTKKTKDIMPDAKSIVVIGDHVWDDMLELAIRKGERWVYPGYIPVSSIEQTASNYIEKQEYKTASYPPLSQKRLAQLVGFGKLGKNALTVNPVYGPWIRLATILTNTEIIPDKPFEQDLCGDCGECVKACAVGALTAYEIDDEKCLVGIRLQMKRALSSTKGSENMNHPSRRILTSCAQNAKGPANTETKTDLASGSFIHA